MAALDRDLQQATLIWQHFPKLPASGPWQQSLGRDIDTPVPPEVVKDVVTLARSKPAVLPMACLVDPLFGASAGG